MAVSCTRALRTCVLLWSTSLALVGCDETIALGSDCPPFGKRCIRVAPREPPADGVPLARPDGGGLATDGGGGGGGSGPGPGMMEGDAAAALGDGGMPLDAGFEDLSPAFDNPSFELTGGTSPGQIGVLSATKINPWYTCSGTVSARIVDDLRNSPSGEPQPADILHPSDGTTLVSMTNGIGPPSLFQTLKMPLVKGQHYAFAVDVVRSGSEEARLHLYGTNTSCIPTVRMAQSTVIKEGRTWQTLCLSFDAPAAYPQVALLTSGTSSTRLFVDDLRSTAACR